MARSVELPTPDPTIHPVGTCHTGKAGLQQLSLLQFYGLRPDSDMLEIGCGIGRLVQTLGPWLDEGTYEGFDISPAAIDWLNENYAPLLPNFHFGLMDVRNDRYRPRAGGRADKAGFPYADDQFDFACSFSVFTHMQLPDIRNYLAELARVLRPGARALMTFYMITDEDATAELKGFGPFAPLGDGVFSATPELPERAIGFDRDLLLSVVGDAGLTAAEVVEGRWHGRNPVVEGPGFDQDFFILTPS